MENFINFWRTVLIELNFENCIFDFNKLFKFTILNEKPNVKHNFLCFHMHLTMNVKSKAIYFERSSIKLKEI